MDNKAIYWEYRETNSINDRPDSHVDQNKITKAYNEASGCIYLEGELGWQSADESYTNQTQNHFDGQWRIKGFYFGTVVWERLLIGRYAPEIYSGTVDFL